MFFSFSSPGTPARKRRRIALVPPRLVAEEGRFERRWTELKDKGNEALRLGDLGDERMYGLALKHYGDALSLAQSPWPQVRALRAVASERGASSLSRAMLIDAVATKVLGYLPLSPQARVPHAVGRVKMRLTTPNLPAAACLSNRLCGNQNIQDTFNFIKPEWIWKRNLSKLRDLDQRGTVVQKSAESTSI